MGRQRNRPQEDAEIRGGLRRHKEVPDAEITRGLRVDANQKAEAEESECGSFVDRSPNKVRDRSKFGCEIYEMDGWVVTTVHALVSPAFFRAASS